LGYKKSQAFEKFPDLLSCIEILRDFPYGFFILKLPPARPCMPTIMHAENISYQWLNTHLPRITRRYSIETLRDKRQQLLAREPLLINDLSEARRIHFRELADELDYDHDWIDEGFSVFHEARQKVTLYDDVLPVLQQLKARFHLVALTNGNADIQKTGLGALFERQISAADVMAAKPDPAMFQKAMQ